MSHPMRFNSVLSAWLGKPKNNPSDGAFVYPETLLQHDPAAMNLNDIDSMSYDDLRKASERIIQTLNKREYNESIRLWSVLEDNTAIAFFREDEFDQAVEDLIQRVKVSRDRCPGNEIHINLEECFVHESEVADRLAMKQY